MWPAIVIDESLTVDRKGLSKTAGGKSVPVQFFGTHDFARFCCSSRFEGCLFCFNFTYIMILFHALPDIISCLLLLSRIRVKQIISFLRGLLSSFHLKCKNQRFIRGLEEAKM